MNLTTSTLTFAAVALLHNACTGHEIKPVQLDNEGVCTTGTAVEVLRPKIMLVLDKSGSMARESWDHDAGPGSLDATRWASLHGVVDQLVANRQESVDFGASLFPSAKATGDVSQACEVASGPEVGISAMNHEAIMDALPAGDAIVEGGTPATAGVKQAVAHLLSLETDDPRAMILVTDGAANCMAGATGQAKPEVFDEELTSPGPAS